MLELYDSGAVNFSGGWCSGERCGDWKVPGLLKIRFHVKPVGVRNFGTGYIRIASWFLANAELMTKTKK